MCLQINLTTLIAMMLFTFNWYSVSDDELIKGCIRENRHCQRALYERFAAKMMTVCVCYTRHRLEAEDILQEGFIKVFNSLEQFRFTGSFEGWVRRIFVNTAIESFRSKKMKFSDLEIQNFAEDFSFDDTLDQIAYLKRLSLLIHHFLKLHKTLNLTF